MNIKTHKKLYKNSVIKILPKMRNSPCLCRHINQPRLNNNIIIETYSTDFKKPIESSRNKYVFFAPTDAVINAQNYILYQFNFNLYIDGPTEYLIKPTNRLLNKFVEVTDNGSFMGLPTLVLMNRGDNIVKIMKGQDIINITFYSIFQPNFLIKTVILPQAY